MKALRLIPVLLLLSLLTQAQTLKIEAAEELFNQNSTQFIPGLKELEFNNLNDDQILEEDFINSPNTSSSSTKDKLYTSKGLRKKYELRKIVYGGLCKLTLNMNEPSCKTVQRLTWNANLSYDTRYYVRELERLDYKREEGSTLEKYINSEKGFSITIKIVRQSNELYLLMVRAA